MKIAVTAASGTLGGAITQAVAHKVGAEHTIALARTPAKAEHLGVPVRPGDYDKPAQLTESLQGVDAVLLVSSNIQPEARIPQHRNVIAAAKAAGVQKLVYTSVMGAEAGNAFSPIIQSNRQTEADVRDSGLQYVIGRNGIYIDADLEYIDHYKQDGKISNCAGEGKCAYTSRAELAEAYARLLSEPVCEGQTLNMTGPAITQTELAEAMNQAYGTQLVFEDMAPAAYREERIAALGDFYGTVIAGIYEGIRQGAFDVQGDYEKAAGRPHKSLQEMIAAHSIGNKSH